jgi:transcriptional regulator with XRE-family HTH domain
VTPPAPKLLSEWLWDTGTTTTQLGAMVGVSHATVSRWATGDRVPGLEHAVRLREITRIPERLWVREE